MYWNLLLKELTTFLLELIDSIIVIFQRTIWTAQNKNHHFHWQQRIESLLKLSLILMCKIENGRWIDKNGNSLSKWWANQSEAHSLMDKIFHFFYHHLNWNPFRSSTEATWLKWNSSWSNWIAQLLAVKLAQISNRPVDLVHCHWFVNCSIWVLSKHFLDKLKPKRM